jgi:hypothetical protein
MRRRMKTILIGYALLLALILGGCSAATNYRKYDFYLDN